MISNVYIMRINDAIGLDSIWEIDLTPDQPIKERCISISGSGEDKTWMVWEPHGSDSSDVTGCNWIESWSCEGCDMDIITPDELFLEML